MKNWGLLDSNDNIKKEYENILNYDKQIRENMVIKGFAYFYENSDDSKGIILNKEGLLLGEVIYNVEKKNPFVKFIYLIYSSLIDYVGAFILLLIIIITLILSFINAIK